MPGKFPHLSDDAFPHLDTVHPYRRTVPFDYDRYDYTASIKLCRVPWPMDYKHVINWQSASARDAYFQNIDGPVVELANGFTRTQLDSVRVNVPYDVALTYNYVYMVVPQLTQDEPINHESANGVRVVCAWIQDCVYYAPSATELVLAVDYWTTYLPNLVPVTLMLHRGHAPAYATDVDAYLADPKSHCEHLLTPDVSYGVPDIVSNSAMIDIAQGSKMLVFASTIPYASIEALTLSQSATGSSTAPTYYDLASRDGHQVGVGDYAWHYNSRTYEGMTNPTAYSGLGAAMPTYSYLYAISSEGAYGALGTLAQRLPQFVTSIEAAYILPRQVLNLAATTYSVAGVTLYRVDPTPDLSVVHNLTLTKAQFGYPVRYADIAKLYSYPYAHLVVSDTLGGEIDLRVEDMGSNPRIMQQISPMVECLRWDILIDGVNAAGTNGYVWRNLNNDPHLVSIPGADIARYTLELGIPTYALYLDARTDSAAADYYSAQIQRANAINAYQAGMRSANTGKENAVASANTSKANADASADTSVTNTANSGRNSQANAAVQNNLRTTSTSRNNTAQSDLTDDAVQHIYDASNADLEYTEYATDINLKSEAVAAIQNLVGNAVSGNAVGVLNAGVSGIVNITTSGDLAQLSLQNVLDHQAIEQYYTNRASSFHMNNATDQTAYANTANTRQTDNTVSTNNTNATNNANTAKANATRSQGTSKENAAYSRITTETNAKAALELAQANYLRQGHANDLANPVAYGSASGDRSADALMRRVVQVRVETQSKSAIARAGDAMLRYGYTYDGLWSVTDWCPESHDGCYWEASDVLVDGSALDNAQAERAFETILMQGVTVWNDPASIGGIPW